MFSSRKFDFTVTKSEDKSKPLPIAISLIADLDTINEVEKILLKLALPIHCENKHTTTIHHKTQHCLTFNYEAEDNLSQDILNLIFISIKNGLSCGEIDPMVEELLMNSTTEESRLWVIKKGPKNYQDINSPTQQTEKHQPDSLKIGNNSIFFKNNPLQTTFISQMIKPQNTQTQSTSLSLKKCTEEEN